MQFRYNTYNNTGKECEGVKLLSVGLKDATDELKERLLFDCKMLIEDGFRVAIEEFCRGSYRFIGCNVVEGELSFRSYERIKQAIKNHVARALAELIILREEKKLVSKIIDQQYYYFNFEEKQQIYENTLRMLNCNSGAVEDFGFTVRRNKILSKITDYLNTHHELILEGFINFRLKEYRDKLNKTVDKAVDDYMQEIEHKEFIKVLQYLVDSQVSRIEEVHVVIITATVYKILDTKGKAISSQCLETYICSTDEEVNYEDLLMTALITLAPYNIMLHVPVDSQVIRSTVETIRNVFEERVMVCSGCELCRTEYDKEKDELMY